MVVALILAVYLLPLHSALTRADAGSYSVFHCLAN
jgi:hypothetical protein